LAALLTTAAGELAAVPAEVCGAGDAGAAELDALELPPQAASRADSASAGTTTFTVCRILELPV
jgi:hypothetical protein